MVRNQAYDHAKRLGTAIREARKQAGLTQSELANLLHLDREYVARVERGVHTRYFDRLVELLDAVGLALVTTPKSLLVDNESLSGRDA